MNEPTSSHDYDIALIVAETPEERLYQYLRFSWDIFKATAEKINREALYKDAATAKHSETAGEVTSATVLAGGAIADFFLPGVGAVTKVAGKVIDRTVTLAGGKIEKSIASTSAKELQNIVGNFNSESPKSYIPITEAFADIFIHFNVQMIYLLDPENLDFHLSKALFKFALDTVSKVFDGFKKLLDSKEKNLPVNFSTDFVIKCFLSGKSEGGIIDKMRAKLPKNFFGKSLGGQLSKGISTEKCFKLPLVKSHDNRGKYFSKI